jgi:hypothetical protein
VGVGVGRLHALGDEEAGGPLGERVAGDEGLERRPVPGLHEVGELVDDHVVEHPAREGREPGREPDGAVPGRARPPPGALVVDPADGGGHGEVEAAGEQLGAGREVDGSGLLRRSKRRTISATHRRSSVADIAAGMLTRSTPSTRRADTVLRRRALRTTSTSTTVRSGGGR